MEHEYVQQFLLTLKVHLSENIGMPSVFSLEYWKYLHFRRGSDCAGNTTSRTYALYRFQPCLFKKVMYV